jgi:Glycosyltransferase like family
LISIISIINNKQSAKECLIRALNLQTAKYESLLIDNTSGIYKSAAQAYNYLGLKANGDYLIFVHQDVFFWSRNWLKEMEEYLSTMSDIGVAGLAGMEKPSFLNEFEICSRYFLLNKIGSYRTWFSLYGRGNLIEGEIGQRWAGRMISEPVPVQTVDELMLVVPAKVFEKNKFDDKTCDSWHLYGVDFSLTLSKKGLKTYVLPFPAVHYSGGKIDAGYIHTLQNIIEKHESEKVINTTCGLYPTQKELVDLFWGPQNSLVPKIVKNFEKLALSSLGMLWKF